MFRWAVGSSLRFRFLLLALAAALLVFGSQELRKMPVDVFPEFAPPKVEIQTEGPGMTAAEVEEMITIPMEEALRGIPNVDVIRSSSVLALSQVTVLFKMGTDLMDARQRVQERVKLGISSLPQSAGMPIILQPLSSTSRVMKIGLSSKTHDPMDLSMIAYWTIKFRLMSVPGVANIPIWGDKIKSLQVQVDPGRMRAHDVTLEEVMETTSDALDFGLLRYTQGAKTRIDGMLDTPNQRLVIHFDSPVFSPEHLAEVSVASKNRRKSPPRLNEVAVVKWDTWPLIGDAVINDGVGLMMIVEKLPWANTLEVTRGVEKVLAELKPGLPGIEIDSTIFRPATFIEQAMGNLTFALISGLVLVIVVLGAFLYEWRVALISAIAIPLSLTTAALVLYHLGATLNTMVLAGFIVALGDVVDDAIIDVENIVRRLREHRLTGDGRSIARVIIDASLEVRTAIVHATLIIVLTVTPVFFMGGLGGSFFAPLALAYFIAMFSSMVVALTVTPALCFMLVGRRSIQQRESPLLPPLKRAYQALLSRAVLTQQASREFRAIPGVRNFGAHIGRAVAGDEPYGVNFTENWISVDRAVDYDKTRATIEAAVASYPGLYRDVQTYLQERIKEVLTGAGESIVIRIFGPELSVMRAKAREVEAAIKDIPGLVDLHVEQQVNVPQIQITTNLETAARHGLKPGDVRRAAAVLMTGVEVTDIHRDAKVYDVFVWSPPEVRGSVDAIREFPIDTAYGGRVRLGEVAEVAVAPTPNKIRRENSSRRLDVHANVRGRDLGSVVSEVEARLAKVQFPIGYHPHLLGEYKERRAAQTNLLIAGGVVAIVIFLLLQTTFRNWRLAALIFLALPAALVGALLANFMSDRVVSLGSLVGIITVLGIAARNSIMLLEHYRHLEHVEGEPFGIGLVLRGANERLSPILMTSLCASLGLVPLVWAGSVPGNEIEHPMAVVILGGIVTSTLLSLFVVPLLYLRFGRQSRQTIDDSFPRAVAPEGTRP